MDSWGLHYISDCHAGDIAKITDEQNIRNFVDALVVRIDMVKYGDLWINRFATHDPNKAGYSFCQMIETSNITGHFCENNGNFYIDVFSCKEFDGEVISNTIQEFFAPKTIGSVIIPRDASTMEGEVKLGV